MSYDDHSINLPGSAVLVSDTFQVDPRHKLVRAHYESNQN